MMNEQKQKLLERILETRFYAEAVINYESLKNFLNHPNFPARKSEFKQELADAILNNKVTPEKYEDLTSHELETQEEVNKLLIDEIWKPLYGDEPIRI